MIFLLRRVVYRFLSLIKTAYYSIFYNVKIGKGSIVFYKAKVITLGGGG